MYLIVSAQSFNAVKHKTRPSAIGQDVPWNTAKAFPVAFRSIRSGGTLLPTKLKRVVIVYLNTLILLRTYVVAVL